MAFKITWVSLLRVFLLLLLLAAIVIAFFTLSAEKMLRDFLVWVKEDLGPWGPLVLAVAYIPLTILAVPASVLTLGGGYLFGLPVGFLADSVGATVGAGAAFLLGRTLLRSFVISKLKDYPRYRAVEIAIRRSGFKLVPLLPFNMLNYLLSVTLVPIVPYLMASWLGMMPITLALVYVGTTLKDLSDITHGWSGFSKTRWAFIALSLVISVKCRLTSYYIQFLLHGHGLDLGMMLMIIVTRVAKSALEKALAENDDIDVGSASPELPMATESSPNLHQPLLIKVDNPQGKRE